MKKAHLVASAVLLSILALAHLARLIFQVEVLIGGIAIPLWVSTIGFLLPLYLAWWIIKSI